jgi:glycosyltransferase involved in cell wall biosynthesis
MEQIDILMATYNGETYLKEQLNSILNQTYSNFRLIISDDCSKDGTRKILEEYAKKDNRITLYFQEKNLGFIKNFEFLLSKVENKIYALSDQDDVWLAEKIEKTYNKMKATDADLVFTDLEVVNEKLEEMYPSFNDFMLLSRKIKKCHNDYKMQYLYNCVTGCTLMSKKKFLDKIVPIPKNSKYVLHDTWIGLVVSLYGKVEYLDEKTIKYRQHGNNQVGTDKISHKFKKLEEVRNLFIEVKLQLFETYVENEKLFPDSLKVQNKKALEYFKDISKKKNVNFKNWNVFYCLYKNETLVYYLENFVIMNFPILARIAFKIRYVILKILGRR